MSSNSFNSTLVQLKGGTATVNRYTITGFNSTLVQLKGDDKEQLAKSLGMFQFYLSSIKSQEMLRLSFAHLRFNSTLVQLKDIPTPEYLKV